MKRLAAACLLPLLLSSAALAAQPVRFDQRGFLEIRQDRTIVRAIWLGWYRGETRLEPAAVKEIIRTANNLSDLGRSGKYKRGDYIYLIERDSPVLLERMWRDTDEVLKSKTPEQIRSSQWVPDESIVITVYGGSELIFSNEFLFAAGEPYYFRILPNGMVFSTFGTEEIKTFCERSFRLLNGPEFGLPSGFIYSDRPYPENCDRNQRDPQYSDDGVRASFASRKPL